MGTYNIPSTTYPWSDWQLSDITCSDPISGNLSADTGFGVAISGAFLAGDGTSDIWYHLKWASNNDSMITVFYDTSDTINFSGNWKVIGNDSVFPEEDQKKYIMIAIL